MRTVEVYLNETRGSAFWAYHPDAKLRCAFRGELDLPDEDMAALDEVFALLNHDQRPGGYTDRSLSVGDVVTLDQETSYAVAALGFTQIPRRYSGDPIIGPLAWEASNPMHELPQPWPPFGTVITD